MDYLKNLIKSDLIDNIRDKDSSNVALVVDKVPQ